MRSDKNSSYVFKVTREGNSLVLDDGGCLTNAFFSVSETKFVAEDADRSLVLENDVMSVDLAGDAAKAIRIGPLPPERATGTDPDEALTARVEQILKAFENGGESAEKVPGVASQGRQDFASGPSVEFRGIKSISFLGMVSLSNNKIIRHGSPGGTGWLLQDGWSPGRIASSSSISLQMAKSLIKM
jgi:hypothetical protein